MIVVVGGPPGSGKTTLAERLAAARGHVLVSAGQTFRRMAADRGLDLAAFGAKAEQDHGIDRELDGRVLEDVLRHDARGDDVVVDGRIQAHLLRERGIPCLKVWVDAPLDVRVARISQREGKDVAEVRRELQERERSERVRYQAIYGIDLRETRIYDLVIDSSDKTPEEVAALVRARVDG